jgi:hypothetical protein
MESIVQGGITSPIVCILMYTNNDVIRTHRAPAPSFGVIYVPAIAMIMVYRYSYLHRHTQYMSMVIYTPWL